MAASYHQAPADGRVCDARRLRTASRKSDDTTQPRDDDARVGATILVYEDCEPAAAQRVQPPLFTRRPRERTDLGTMSFVGGPNWVVRVD